MRIDFLEAQYIKYFNRIQSLDQNVSEIKTSMKAGISGVGHKGDSVTLYQNSQSQSKISGSGHYSRNTNDSSEESILSMDSTNFFPYNDSIFMKRLEDLVDFHRIKTNK